MSEVPPGAHPIGTILRDDDHRPVKVLHYYRQDLTWKVRLGSDDPSFLGRYCTHRWWAEVCHYPLIKKA